MRGRPLLPLLPLLALGLACSDPASAPGTQVLFDLDADLASPPSFYDFPYPSDLRLTEDGAPDLRGFPNPGDEKMIAQMLAIAPRRTGWPTIPVAYFRFTDAVAAREADDVIAADPGSPILLVDVDPASPERGRLLPTVAKTLAYDDYAPQNLLAAAARPGFVLAPGRSYAFVIRRSLGDAQGEPLDVPAALADLAAGRTPAGARGAAARDLYARLWPALAAAGVPAGEVAAATVFTTGDVVADVAALAGRVAGEYTIEIRDLALDPDDGVAHERFCELLGQVTYPQFQTGTPPYDSDGVFQFGEDGLPVKQRDEQAPIVITLPRQPMPADGYPLVLYFHGSGGRASQAVDSGADVEPEKGRGPAHVLAAHGLGTAASALPLSPDRVPGAGDYDYLNLYNLSAFPDVFRQGVIEQRLFLDAVLALRIPADVVAACTGPELPAGETAFRFDAGRVLAQGQSMGGMYTNMVGATDARIRAVVPTGAGGFWSYFILVTSLIDGAKTYIEVALGAWDLTFLHPAMHLLELAWEAAEPLAYMPRLARRPLAGHPVRPIYEPVGKDDSYFATVLYDAIALAYGHRQAGDVVWPSMQEALSLAGLDGVLPYPVADDLEAEDGTAYTGVVVQYAGDGVFDPHSIYRQLDAVKYQYGCFFETFLATGVARVLAPAALDSACE